MSVYILNIQELAIQYSVKLAKVQLLQLLLYSSLVAPPYLLWNLETMA